MSGDEGRYVVGRYWTRWSVQDQSWNPPRIVAGPYDLKADAEAEARRLNARREATR